jgi:hypothetical protein
MLQKFKLNSTLAEQAVLELLKFYQCYMVLPYKNIRI